MATLFEVEGYTVRSLRRDEVPAVQALFEDHPGYFVLVGGRPPQPDEAQQEFDETPPAHLPYTQRWFAGVFDGTHRLRGVLVVVADLGAPGVWHTALFLLDERARGTGAAMRLHGAMQAWARRGGAQWLRLAVIAGNAAAERFWAKCGYQEVRTRPYVNASGATVTARVLVKPLGEAAVAEYLALVPRDRPGSTLP